MVKITELPQKPVGLIPVLSVTQHQDVAHQEVCQWVRSRERGLIRRKDGQHDSL